MASWVSLFLAAAFTLTPSSVTLDAVHQFGQIVMRSLDARTIVFDLEPVAWTQAGDADSFAPSPDLLAVPLVYEIEPHETAMVRVGLREPQPAGETERAFQVRFREVAAAGEPARTLSAYVFVAPAQRRGEVRYEIRRDGERQAQLIVHDDANVHVALDRVSVRVGEHQVCAASLGAYVLPGNSRTFELALTQPLAGERAELTIVGGDTETTVDVPVR